MLDLYISEYCPYCKKVMNFLRDNNIAFNEKNVNNNGNFEKLISLGGKDQVPFLNDTENNIMMYESDDIIEYVKSLQG